MNELTRDQFQELLKHTLEIEQTDEAILVGGIIIAEWMMPNGRRFLTRNGIGHVTEWQAQGYLYSTIDGDGWNITDDEEEV